MQQEDGTFTDETDSRMPLRMDYTHGIAVGDIDGDGDEDLFMVNLAGDVDDSPSLLINDGDEFFTETW